MCWPLLKSASILQNTTFYKTVYFPLNEKRTHTKTFTGPLLYSHTPCGVFCTPAQTQHTFPQTPICSQLPIYAIPHTLDHFLFLSHGAPFQ